MMHTLSTIIIGIIGLFALIGVIRGYRIILGRVPLRVTGLSPSGSSPAPRVSPLTRFNPIARELAAWR